MALPDDVDPRMLDPEARKELRPLVRETADLVARHLVMTGRLLDEDPEQALVHARAARAMAGRIGVVREAAGLAAYAAGEWAEALAELRAARRITGEAQHLGVAADCERALGRPERALAYADDPDVAALEQDQRVELVIVLAGARRDLDQADAAVLLLQDPARRTTDKRPWAARLWYAYADALLDAGRLDEAREWFGKTADLDADGETDAGDRVLELDGVVLPELEDDDDPGARDDLPTAEELAAYARAVPVPGASWAPEPGSGDPADGSAGPATDDAPDDAVRPAADEAAAEPVASRDEAPTSVEPRSTVEPAGATRPGEAQREPQGPLSNPFTSPAVDGPEPAVRPAGGVAPPTFVAAPQDADDEDDLRLFD